MKIKLPFITFGSLALAGSLAHAAPLGTAFNYQGRLDQDNQPAPNGIYQMTFALFAADSGGNPLMINTVPIVPVTNGLFNTSLDYGLAAFVGDDRWLEITVRTNNGSLPYTLLTPRTRLAPTPYALYALTTGAATNVANGAVSAAGLATAAGPAAGMVLTYDGSTLTWQSVAGISGAWATNGITAAPGSFVGTVNNLPLEFRANNAGALRLEPNATSPNIIGGWSGNSVDAGVGGATIAGGGAAAQFSLSASNRVTDHFGTIGGGAHNLAGNTNGTFTDAYFATVGGGHFNSAKGTSATIAGGANNEAQGENGTVAGGYLNSAAGPASAIAGGTRNTAFGVSSSIGGGERNTNSGNYATIGGGEKNTASASRATVSGGEFNAATAFEATIAGGAANLAEGADSTIGGGHGNYTAGSYATVPGGLENQAIGPFSFAAGYNARALHLGAFVWSDASPIIGGGGFSSVTSNEFAIRAVNGVRLNTDTSMYFGNQTRQMLNLWGTQYGVGVQASTLYFRTHGVFAWHRDGEHVDGIENPGPGGLTQMTLDDNFLMVRGSGGEAAYIGGDGTGGDVQVGSLNPEVTTVALYNAANNTYMNLTARDVSTRVLTIYGGADLAEPFPINEESIEKGSVVVIDEEHPGRLQRSTRAYDTRVAGIVSGANGINPGISLQQEGALDHGENVALTGRVYVKADASYGAIKPGDLLTTSETPGHAMIVNDHTKAQGAILGKAMGSLKEGTGLVLVLVTLQ